MGGGLATLIRDNMDFDEDDRKLVVLVSDFVESKPQHHRDQQQNLDIFDSGFHSLLSSENIVESVN